MVNMVTTLSDSKLIDGLDYITIQRVIGEDLKFLDLVYKASRDGFSFHDLSRRLNQTKQHISNYKDKKITWVYLIQVDNMTFGFRTIMKNNELVECYMFLLNFEQIGFEELNSSQRFYTHLNNITVESHYPSGFDLFDSPGVGHIDKQLEFDSNGLSLYTLFKDIVEHNLFNINEIELYVTTPYILERSIHSPKYRLSYETEVRFNALNSEILTIDNINLFEDLITPLDNTMFYSRLINTDSIELFKDRDVDFDELTDNHNVLILFQTIDKTFALYIPRRLYDDDESNTLTLYSLSLNEVIPLDEYYLDITEFSDESHIRIAKNYGEESIKLIKLEFNENGSKELKPMSGVSYNIESNISPSTEFTLNEIFSDTINVSHYEVGDNDYGEYLFFKLDYVKVEVYLVGRDELMHGIQHKRDVREYNFM